MKTLYDSVCYICPQHHVGCLADMEKCEIREEFMIASRVHKKYTELLIERNACLDTIAETWGSVEASEEADKIELLLKLLDELLGREHQKCFPYPRRQLAGV